MTKGDTSQEKGAKLIFPTLTQQEADLSDDSGEATVRPFSKR